MAGPMPVAPRRDRRVTIAAVSAGEQANAMLTVDGEENPPPDVLERLQLVQAFVAELEAGTSG